MSSNLIYPIASLAYYVIFKRFWDTHQSSFLLIALQYGTLLTQISYFTGDKFSNRCNFSSVAWLCVYITMHHTTPSNRSVVMQRPLIKTVPWKMPKAISHGGAKPLGVLTGKCDSGFIGKNTKLLWVRANMLPKDPMKKEWKSEKVARFCNLFCLKSL